MECFKRYPVFTVRYNNSCVIECLYDKPYIFNGECVSQCPKDYVLDKGVCQPTCSYGQFLFNKTCVDKCQEEWSLSMTTYVFQNVQQQGYSG